MALAWRPEWRLQWCSGQSGAGVATGRLGDGGGASTDATGGVVAVRKRKGMMAVQREQAAVGHLPHCRWLTGETQAFDETSSSSGFSFCQNQRGGQRVAGRRRPGLAFKGGGKVQHLVWKLIGGGAPVRWGGGLMLPLPVRWFLS
uniref:Uncharacterized protein n=1 Tax=Oryza glumipatula TaxID=40148 RepID=A0A0E0BRZ0_9ORYZ